MSTRITMLALIVILAAPVAMAQGMIDSPREGSGYEVGATVAADIKLKDIYGKEHSLGDYRGKVVFIHFWSTVCPTIKRTEPLCNDLQKEFSDKGVVQIAINANQRELETDGDTPYQNLRAHVENAGVKFLVAVDPGNKITDMFDAKTTPHCFVIDQNGVLRYAGALDDDPRGSKGDEATPYVRNAIAALLDGKPVPVENTKPYG